jgi:hypothetical protein
MCSTIGITVLVVHGAGRAEMGGLGKPAAGRLR